MTTIAELHKEIIRELTALYSPDEARAISYGLLQHFGKFSRTQLHAFPNTEQDIEQNEDSAKNSEEVLEQ